MRVRQLNIKHTPLQQSFSLVVRGGSLLQVHAAEIDEFIPDREITPLVIAPVLYLTNADNPELSGNVEQSLSDVRWYENSESPENLIVSGQNGYERGANGTLIVGKNVEYMSPLMLIVTANYHDGRSKSVIRVSESVTLSTTSHSSHPITLELDKPGSWTFDPLTDTGWREINATLRLAANDVTETNAKFWWFIVSDGVEREIVPNRDLFYESGIDTPKLTIDPRYINGSVLIRCRAEYIRPNATAPAQPTTKALMSETVVNRRYSHYDYTDFVNGGEMVSQKTTDALCEGIVSSRGRVIERPQRFFHLEWFSKPNRFGADWKHVDFGINALIPIADIENGVDVGFSVKEREALGAMMINGDVITDNGLIITL